LRVGSTRGDSWHDCAPSSSYDVEAQLFLATVAKELRETERQ
jgi:hypothetical protein